MKEFLRLKDLNNINSKEVDYNILAKEVFGYKNLLFGNKHSLIRKIQKAKTLVAKSKNIKPELIVYYSSSINKPKNIDTISFRAMMELKSILNSFKKNDDFQKYVAQIISIVCYQENYKDKYDSNSENFNKFISLVLEQPIWEMIGLYNWIVEASAKTDLEWSERFFSVQVEDKDYELAGGSRMNQFNVINTIKSICSDFNCSYDEAWQMSYALTQTNSYAKATQNHIQDQMRILKELKMKNNKNN